MSTLNRYTLGFVFDHRLEHGGVKQAPPTSVLLVRKARPTWQAGRLNGLGGMIEPGESPEQCIAREVEEESRRWNATPGERGVVDIPPVAWRRFGVLRGAEVYNPAASSAFEVHLFSAFLGVGRMVDAEAHTTGNPEPLVVMELHELLMEMSTQVLPNVRWMVSMALSFFVGKSAECFEVRECTLAQLDLVAPERAPRALGVG